MEAKDSITLRVFYSRVPSLTVSAALKVDINNQVKDVIALACAQFGIQKAEKYGLERRNGSTPTTTKGKTFLQAKDNWLHEHKTVAASLLHDGEELVLRVKNKFSSGPNALKIIVPSANFEMVAHFTYTTTVREIMDSTLEKIGSEKAKLDPHAIARWKMFLPIGSPKNGIWMDENRTIDSYDLYAHKGEEELPSFEEVLRVLILCRRIEDRDNAVLPKNAFKNHKELKWLARLEDLESYKQKNHKKFKLSIRKGLPETLRGNIWLQLSGASEKIVAHQGQYLRYLHTPIDEHIQACIYKDLDRTFPNHPFFQSNMLGWQSLKNVLTATAAKNPDIGYCQGMNFIAGVLLLVMDEESAFWLFDTILYKYEHWKFFVPNMPGLQAAIRQLKKLIEINLPEVARTLNELSISPSIFASSWFHTLFSYNCQLPFVFRIWDIYLNEGPSILFRVALAILKEGQSNIIGKSMEQVIMFLQKSAEQISDIDLVLYAAGKISNHKLMARFYSDEEFSEVLKEDEKKSHTGRRLLFRKEKTVGGIPSGGHSQSVQSTSRVAAPSTPTSANAAVVSPLRMRKISSPNLTPAINRAPMPLAKPVPNSAPQTQIAQDVSPTPTQVRQFVVAQPSQIQLAKTGSTVSTVSQSPAVSENSSAPSIGDTESESVAVTTIEVGGKIDYLTMAWNLKQQELRGL